MAQADTVEVLTHRKVGHAASSQGCGPAWARVDPQIFHLRTLGTVAFLSWARANMWAAHWAPKFMYKAAVVVPCTFRWVWGPMRDF